MKIDFPHHILLGLNNPDQRKTKSAKERSELTEGDRAIGTWRRIHEIGTIGKGTK